MSILSFEVIPEQPWWSFPSDTKAVKGMNATFERRPRRNGSKGNRWWMLNQPTLDSLWFAKGARTCNLRMARRLKGGAS